MDYSEAFLYSNPDPILTTDTHYIHTIHVSADLPCLFCSAAATSLFFCSSSSSSTRNTLYPPATVFYIDFNGGILLWYPSAKLTGKVVPDVKFPLPPLCTGKLCLRCSRFTKVLKKLVNKLHWPLI